MVKRGQQWIGLSLLVAVGCGGSPTEEPDALGTDTQELASKENPLGFYGGSSLPALTAQLTFDDGPTQWTTGFLDILEKKGVKGTFFINSKGLKGSHGLDGSYVDAVTGATVPYLAVMRRISREGHVIGNHTVTHPDLGALSVAAIAAELDANQKAINVSLVKAGVPRQPVSLIRPPFGSPWSSRYSTAVRERVSGVLVERGLNVLWNIDSSDSADWAKGEWYRTGDASRPYDPTQASYLAKVARLRSRVLGSSLVKKGAGVNVLFHDSHPTSRDALEGIIDGLVAKGYRFVTTESAASTKWHKPSRDLTPGPGLFKAALPESEWGCLDYSSRYGEPAKTRARQVCGRMWRTFTAFGGGPVFGYPTKAPTRSTTSGIVRQWFNRSRLELKPDVKFPKDVRTGYLGEERVTQLGINWRTSALKPFLPEPSQLPGCVYVHIVDSLGLRDIRHNVCDRQVSPGGKVVNTGFMSLRGTYGGNASAVFGAPISAAFYDAPRKRWVQWFDKSRFEHKDSGPAGKVIIAALGDELQGLVTPPVITHGTSSDAPLVASAGQALAVDAAAELDEGVHPADLVIQPALAAAEEGEPETIAAAPGDRSILDGDGDHAPLQLTDAVLAENIRTPSADEDADEGLQAATEASVVDEVDAETGAELPLAGGCSVAPGGFLGLAALALTLRRRRRRPGFPPEL